MSKMTRKAYGEMFGPTTGDGLELSDTGLVAIIEKDHTVLGDECLHGGGKTLRDGSGMNSRITSEQGALDMLLVNATVIDAVVGVVKGDVGIKDGRIVGIGKGGNPDIMDGVDPRLIVGTSTTVRDCEGLIATAGGIDMHVHFDSAALVEHAISSGITTMIGGGLGPITVGIDSGGPFNVGKMLQSASHWPMNFGFLGRGNAHSPETLIEQMKTGALGLKIHEDWGAMPSAIRNCLSVADDLDFQVQIHSDTLNESGFLEDTVAAFENRTIHMYHAEGAGGGHAPDIISVAGIERCLPSSTTPTIPWGVNTFEEHLDMTMSVHALNPNIPEDVAFAESRIRPQSIAAEDLLHDMGAISMIGSDSQGMGRIHETISRTWQLASIMKQSLGALPEEQAGLGDNERILRYIAKYTINPAKTFGIDEHVGSLEDGKLADVVVWKPGFFGVKPELIVKGGFIAWGAMGDSAASLMTSEPVALRPQWGAFGKAAQNLSASFVHPSAIENNLAEKLGLGQMLLPTSGTRDLTKADMVRNDSLPKITVDPSTFDVYVNDELAYYEPSSNAPLAQRYLLR